MILEGIVTTRNADGSANIAPMGPMVNDPLTRLLLRPFPTSLTYSNLHRERCGVFHVVDDVLLLAQAAIDRLHELPELEPATTIPGEILQDCCRWYEFRVTSIDESGPRPRFEATVVAEGRRRDFFGFNRGKHAVIEAAIVASRRGLMKLEEIEAEFDRLWVPVEKTGGNREKQAFELLEAYIQEDSGQRGTDRASG